MRVFLSKEGTRNLRYLKTRLAAYQRTVGPELEVFGVSL